MVHVTLFGQFTVSTVSGRLGPRDLGGVKAKQLLEMLVLANGRPVAKERLAQHLWGDVRPQNAAATIETYVSLLRRRLESLGCDARGLIETGREAYRFAVEAVELDSARFDALLDEADPADPRVARQRLEEALALATGDILEDEPYAAWADDVRRTYRARMLGARLDAAHAALAERDFESALSHARAAAHIDRYAERAYRIVMLALYALGQQAAALDAFRCAYETLAGELGLEPSPETRRVQAAMLRQQDPLLLLPPTAGPVDGPAEAAVFILDPENDRIVDANALASELLGYEREELRTTPISVIHPAEMPELLRFMERARRDGHAQSLVLTCRTKSGDYLPANIVAEPLELDGRQYLIALVVERSEHRRGTRSRAQAA